MIELWAAVLHLRRLIMGIIDQLSLPAGFSPDGDRMVSLRDVISPKIATIDFPQLSPEKKAELTIARLEQQPDFKLGMVGIGVVDKDRAILEVKKQTPAGKTLVEIEQRTIARAMRAFSSQQPAEEDAEASA
jgi:hypothetical protein